MAEQSYPAELPRGASSGARWATRSTSRAHVVELGELGGKGAARIGGRERGVEVRDGRAEALVQREVDLALQMTNRPMLPTGLAGIPGVSGIALLGGNRETVTSPTPTDSVQRDTAIRPPRQAGSKPRQSSRGLIARRARTARAT